MVWHDHVANKHYQFQYLIFIELELSSFWGGLGWDDLELLIKILWCENKQSGLAVVAADVIGLTVTWPER